MKSFVRDISIIASILLLIMIICCFLNKRINSAVLNGDVFIIKKNIDIVITGDSNTMTAIDPDLLPNSINLSQTAENYFFTYYKLKQIFKKNKHIKTVVLGVSYSNFTMNIEKSFYDDGINERFFDMYYWLLDMDGKKVLFNKYNVRDWLKYEVGVPFQLYKNNLKIRRELLKSKTDFDLILRFFGGYYRGSGSSITDKTIESYVKETYFDASGDYIGNSTLALTYLNNILSLCRLNEVRVILVSTPLSSGLIKRIPPQAKLNYQLIITQTLKNNVDVYFYDFSEMPFDNSCFGDANHLNGTGSDIFSRKFSLLLNKQNHNNTIH